MSNRAHTFQRGGMFVIDRGASIDDMEKTQQWIAAEDPVEVEQ